VVVNQALVDRDLKGEEPIGKRFWTSDTTMATIVGVVTNIRNVGPLNDPAPEMYWSYRENGSHSTSFPLLVRVKRGDPAAVASEISRVVREVDPGAAISRIQPLQQVIDASVGRQRFYLVLLEVFAGVALVLAVAGLYGLTRYAVSRRTREIGIRSALGATPGQTVSLVLREGLLLVFGGLVVGGGIALLATRLLRNLLYGVSSLDPLAWAVVASLLVASGAVASLLPARRAARVDPLQSIRTE
jgi:ABC-type antimicrobial peptide transport system permease subunit